MKTGVPTFGVGPVAIRRLTTGDPKQDTRDRQKQEELRKPLSCPLLYGAQFDCETPDVLIDLTITHGLGRVPLGWFVVGQRDYPFHMVEISRSRTTLVLERSFSASVDSRFSLWIY